MKRWTINIENARKFLKEEYPENRYLIEPRGYKKDVWGKEFWIFVNDMIDWRTGKDKDEEIGVSDIMKISHIFRVDNYLICVYTSAKGEELKKQLKSIFYAIDYASEGRDSYAAEKFVEWFDEIEKGVMKHIKRIKQKNSRRVW